MNICKCGCKNQLKEFYYKHGKKIVPKYKLGHNKARKAKIKESTNRSTMYTRSKTLLKPVCCMFDMYNQCSGRFEIHHIDKSITNNHLSNLIQVCTTHHRLIHSGKFNIEKPSKLKFKTDLSGKRRYIHD